MNLDIATAPRAAAKTWKRDTTTWSDVCDWVADPRNGGKDGPGYVLGRLSSSRRTKDTIESRCVLTLDADHLTPATRDALLARVRVLGCATAIYSTYTSTPAAPRLRILVLAVRTMTPDEYREVVRWLMRQLGSEMFDPSCAEPERFMYMPTRPAEGEYFSEVIEGDSFDVDDALMRSDLENAALPASPASSAERTGNAPIAPEIVPEDVVQGEVAWVLGKLDALAALAEDERIDWPGQPDGVGWDLGGFLAAQRLAQAANSSRTYTLDDAEADFMDHAPAAEGTYNPSHKWAQAVKTVGSGGLLRRESAAEAFSEPLPDEVNIAHGPFQRMSLRELLDPNRPPREWVVDGLLLAGTATAFIAPAGHRKSLVSLAAALAVARGDDEWAGMAIPKARRVVYVDMENTEDDLRDRLVSFGVTEDVDNFILLSMPGMKPLDTKAGGEEFLAALDAFGMQPGDLVVLDSYQRITVSGENDSDTTRAFYTFTGIGLKKRGLTVIRTDNTGKDTTRGARGSSGKRDDVDVEYVIKSDGDLIEFNPTKARQGGIKLLTVRVVASDGRTTFTSSHGDTRGAADRDKCVAWLDEHDVELTTGVHKVWAMDGVQVFKRAVVQAAIEWRRERGRAFDDQP